MNIIKPPKYDGYLSLSIFFLSISLDTAEFYAFVINNEHLLRNEFREVSSLVVKQAGSIPSVKTSTFRMLEQDFFKYDYGVKNEVEFLSNAYNKYSSGFVTDRVRSKCEQLFEKYCEKREDIEWVYKNGDKGQQYFSIVYTHGVKQQSLFYADYIVMKKDGSVWVIETKGGESKGIDQNIDVQIENKFNAFKAYANNHDIKWGFVRNKDGELYINNTVYADSMADEHWQPIEAVF